MHQGHRARVRQRYLQEGLDSFNEHQIIELLLFYSIPRKNTNEIAHKLIDRFGSLSGVLDAGVKELMKVEGISENSAVFLSMLPNISRIYLKSKWGNRPKLNSSTKAGEYVVDLFTGRSYEVFYVLCLDAQNRLIHAVPVHEGTINEAPIYPRIIIETVLNHKANSVILAHNHPGGSTKPSQADINATEQIAVALDSIQVRLVDHIIAAGDNYVSLAEKNLIP